MKIKNIYRNTLLILTGLVFILVPCSYKAQAQGSAYCVIDPENNAVLDQSNMNLKLEMASTTKIMTAIIALENIPSDLSVSIKRSYTMIEGSSMNLREGEIYTVEDLLYGLMLSSGNDAAIALSCAVAGSEEMFVEMMNDKAKELGLQNTSFKNPHGLHHKDHYTSAYDLAVLCSYAMNNAKFREIVSTESKIITQLSSNTSRTIYNKNRFLESFDGADGIKIGYTTNAGRCLCASAIRNGRRIICVLLNEYDWFNKAEILLDKQF